MEKLTKRAVDALKPSRVGIEGSERFLWDGELKGFGVRASPGGRKSFIVQYRTPEGRHRRTVIGHYGLMTVEQARVIAREKLVAVSKGVDPAAPVEPDGSTTTVGEICDWYLLEANAGRILGRRRRLIKASTLAMDKSRIETHIRPLLGDRRVSSPKLGDIEAMQADIATGKTAKGRAGPRGGTPIGGEGVAARTVSSLHSIFEHGVRWGKIDSNPARGVRKLASTPRERRLSTAEIARLGTAMRTLAAAGEHPTGLAAIRLLLLTGFRRMECLALQRAWVDAEQRAIRLPETKTGPQMRVVGQAAIDLILAQPVTDGSPYVFPADWGNGHFIGVVRVLERVCGAARLADVTPHTLRHTFASVAGDLGFSELTIAALLGHAARGVTQRYVHIDEALRVAADKVAAALAALLDGQPAIRSGSAERTQANSIRPADSQVR